MIITTRKLYKYQGKEKQREAGQLISYLVCKNPKTLSEKRLRRFSKEKV